MESAFAKLGRAEEHLNSIDNALKVWKLHNPNMLVGHFNADRTEHHFHAGFAVAPDPVRWALMAGDCVHSLRSALDHCIWDIAQVEGLPDKRKREFPIFIHREKFDAELETKLGGITNTAVRAVITAAQPWNVAELAEYHSLWVIHELDRVDKHRTLTVVPVVPRWVDYEIVLDYGSAEADAAALPAYVVSNNAREVIDNALLFTVYTPSRPIHMEMEYGVQLGIGIEHMGRVDGGLTGTFGNLCKYTRRIVEQLRDCLV